MKNMFLLLSSSLLSSPRSRILIGSLLLLGVMIDRNLNFTEHVDYIGRKVGTKLGVLRRVGKDITPYMRCIVYKSVIAPLFVLMSTVPQY